MRLNDGTADGQAHAGALALGGEECSENLVSLPGWQTSAHVAHGNEQLTIRFQLRGDRKVSSRIRLIHGIDTVKHQVHQYLLQ
jgi:hypothetical protein